MRSLLAHKFTKLTLEDLTDQMSLMSLQGPQSQQILASLSEDQKHVQQLAFAKCDEIALRTITGQVCNPK